MFAEAKKRDLGMFAAVGAIALYAMTGSALVGKTLVQATPEPEAQAQTTQLVARR